MIILLTQILSHKSQIYNKNQHNIVAETKKEKALAQFKINCIKTGNLLTRHDKYDHTWECTYISIGKTIPFTYEEN